MATARKLLGEILVESKALDPARLREALQRQLRLPGKKLGEVLLEMQAITPRQLSEALARQFNFPFVDLKKVQIGASVLKLVPRNLAEELNLVPVKEIGPALAVAMADPLDIFAPDRLRFVLNRPIQVFIAPPEDIREAIVRLYGTKDQHALTTAIEKASATAIPRPEPKSVSLDAAAAKEDDDAPIIRFIQVMLQDAVKARASDVHIEPMANRVRIRFRVDGVCREANTAPKHLQGPLISRIKIMAGLDIAEKRKPQDGRIQFQTDGRSLDVRASFLPSIHGESVVLRLLDRSTGLVSLSDLGFHPTEIERFRALIRRPNGILLVTGPTGSGKTTTLYAVLSELNRPDVKIITAENPVEYSISGLNQAQVKESIGLTFPRILRAMLRQAPNIILVGEIRDRETAEIAIQAALTGHLVFSTLHTNDAPSALTRLLDIGVKPFLVASSVQAVLAQRLIRVLCPACRKPDPHPEESMLSALGLRLPDIRGRMLYRPGGCESCRGTGYRGRKGIFELMEVDATVREMVFHGKGLREIREQARRGGMVTLLEDAARKVLEGITSLEEAVATTRREDVGYL